MVILASASLLASLGVVLEVGSAGLRWLNIVQGGFEQIWIAEKGFVAEYYYRLAITTFFRISRMLRIGVESSPV